MLGKSARLPRNLPGNSCFFDPRLRLSLCQPAGYVRKSVSERRFPANHSLAQRQRGARSNLELQRSPRALFRVMNKSRPFRARSLPYAKRQAWLRGSVGCVLPQKKAPVPNEASWSGAKPLIGNEFPACPSCLRAWLFLAPWLRCFVAPSLRRRPRGDEASRWVPRQFQTKPIENDATNGGAMTYIKNAIFKTNRIQTRWTTELHPFSLFDVLTFWPFDVCF